MFKEMISIGVLNLAFFMSVYAQSYQLIWSDEFDVDGSVDSTKWVFEEGFQRNQELQWYQKENAWVEDGNLIIEARRDTVLNPNYDSISNEWKLNRSHAYYTSSSLNTIGKHSWKYGRFEIRAKVSNLMGTWPAIWTVGDSCEWPSNGEIDIMENYQGKILANFAWGSDYRWSAIWDDSRKYVSDLGTNWEDEFHVWSLDWTEDSMSIYVDDVLLNDIDLSETINGTSACEGMNPFHQNHLIWLNMAIGGNEDHLKIDGLNRGDQVIIYDLYGRALKSIDLINADTEIGVSDILNGVYLIHAFSKEKSLAYTNRFLKQN